MLDSDKVGMMAMRIWFSGYQRRRSRRPYEWATFAYLEPEVLLSPSSGAPV